MLLYFLPCLSVNRLCSCVSYTVRQVLACVLVSLTLCVKCSPVLFFSYSVGHVLVCVHVSLTLCVKS